MRRQLLDDLSAMEDALSRVADRSDIWQDRIIHAICKAVYDIIVVIIRKELWK
jgi:hypothetical protein